MRRAEGLVCMCLALTQRSGGSNSLNRPSNINSHSFHCLTLGRLDNVKSSNRTAMQCVCVCVRTEHVSGAWLFVCIYNPREPVAPRQVQRG